MKLKPTITRSCGGQDIEMPRCQALNRTNDRAGRQCHNQVSPGQLYCHLHQPKAVFTPQTFELGEAEVCVQFDDDDPMVVYDGGPDATGPVRIEFLPPFTEGGSQIEFEHNGKRFRMFVRRRVS